MMPSLSNSWVNWDDPAYVLENPLLDDFSLIGISSIFNATEVKGAYHPLTILSYSLDKHFSDFNPWFYHAHNLLLHLLNSVLAYWFVWILSRKIFLTIVVSLLFDVHLMHVKSVAWVSARKDVLYTAYFMMSLITWISYIRTSGRSKLLYLVSFFLFMLSSLSKPMAMTLPGILLLLDYFEKRTIWQRLMVEKLPFLIISFIVGVMAIRTQQLAGDMGELIDLKWSQSIVFGLHGLLIYLVKSVIPFGLSGFYPYPDFEVNEIPWYMTFSIVPLALLASVIWFKFRSKRSVIFGFLFFSITIGPALQFISFGNAIVSERFTYVPFIGLFFVSAILLNWLYVKIRPFRKVAFNPSCRHSGVYNRIVSNRKTRCSIWKDNISLWTDVIEEYPNDHLAYCNRATTHGKQGDLGLALNDCINCINLNSDLPESFNNRGMTLAAMGKLQDALSDFDKALTLDSRYITALVNRAGIFMQTDRFDLARQDLEKASQ